MNIYGVLKPCLACSKYSMSISRYNYYMVGFSPSDLHASSQFSQLELGKYHSLIPSFNSYLLSLCRVLSVVQRI